MAKPPLLAAAPLEGITSGRATADRAGAAIRLTASAERYATSNSLRKTVAEAAIGPDAAVGDVVSFTAEGQSHDFAIVRRRWLVEDGTTVLEITLDHPARRGG